jgi:hypothetical protein
MSKIGKTFALFLILIMAVSCLTLLMAKSTNAQAMTVQPMSSPVIIATPTPTPMPTDAPTPTPSPTPIPNVSLDYAEISKTTEGNDTVVVLRITATYNFGDTIIYDYPNFVLDIQTSRGGLEPYPIYLLTGTAKPLQTGSVTVDSNNRIADFTLTFRFSTIQNSFGGPIHFAYYELVYNSNAVSTSTLEPTPSLTPTQFPSPAVPELSGVAVLPLFAATLFIAVKLRQRKNTTSNQ